ncbi:MAG: hypothetical protein DDG60_03850 [Anaerolineae bacterium]|nr:MAG: hypothetical protein DDG60_03850 [Anaerolineae bacterium]
MKRVFLLFALFSIVLSACNLPRPAAGTPAAPASPTQAEAAAPPEFEIRAVTIISPVSGETYPFFSSLPVFVSAASGKAEISRQELLVNGTVAVTQEREAIQPVMHWLANVPGRNTLQARLQLSDGQTLTSEAIEININPEPVGFDILKQTTGGETFANLAGQFGLDPESVAAYNPGIAAALDEPLPAGLVLRLPVEPYIPPEVLAQFAPGAANPLNGGLSTLPGEPSAFGQPSAPSFDLNLPPTFEKVYYYLSLDGGPWSRVPRLPDTFITPAQGFFNLDEVLKGVVAPPAQGTLRAEVEAWGWSGGVLVYIGRFEKVFVAEAGREPFVLLPGQLEICDLPSPNCAQGFGQFGGEAINNTGGKHELRWSPPPGAEGGVWQVSRYPFDSACAPDPAGVFRSGGVNADAAQIIFKVDFPAPGQDAYSIPIVQPGVGNVSLSSAWFPQTYYVRVLPVFNGAVQCVPSNAVTLTVDPRTKELTIVAPTPQPTAPAPPVVFDVKIVEFTPIQFPDGKFSHCVVIVENPFYEKKSAIVGGWLSGPYYVNGQVTLLQNIHPGTTLCPKPYQYKEPPFLEQAGQFLIDALNNISKAYEILKQLAVKLVVKATPYCYASEFIEAYKEEIDSVCNTAAEVIVQAAMTYVGLPPSIPNYEQLKETAKGKLTDLAVQQLEEQTGLPCVEICQDFIRDRVDELWAAGENLLSNQQPGCIGEKEAHNLGFEPLCLPGNVKTEPEPRGLLLPAQVLVQVTRRTDAPDSSLPNSLLFETTCNLTVSTSAVNNAWVGQSIFLGTRFQTGKMEYWQGTTLNAYDLFKPERLPIELSSLAPGESREFRLALQPNQEKFPPQGSSKFWLPGRLALAQEYWYGNGQSANIVAYDDWEYYYLGAELSVNAAAACVTRPNSNQDLAPSNSAASDTWVEQIPTEKLP